MNGAAIVAPHVDNEFLIRVQKLARFMRWTAISVIPEVYEACLGDNTRKFPEASTLFFCGLRLRIWDSPLSVIEWSWICDIAAGVPCLRIESSCWFQT